MAVSLPTSATAGMASGARLGIAQQIIAFAEVLVLGVWLGSMIFFSFAVAPSAFAVLPTRELAGVLVTSTIAKVEVLGLLLGSLLLLLHALGWRERPASTSIKTLRIVLVLVMIAAAVLSRFWITPAMVSLRAAMGGHIDDLPVTDPTRVHFNALHQYSVALMSTAMVAGLAVLYLTVRLWFRELTSSTTTR